MTAAMPIAQTVHGHRVEVIDQPLTPGARWAPAVGETTLALLDRSGLTPTDAARVRDEAQRILSRCVPPNGADETDTGLVIGYVQSGKTMSFTTVAALARDNGYPFVIVIAGTSIPLSSQSTERLLRDLGVSAGNPRAWRHFANPKRTARGALENVIAEWRDDAVPTREKQAALITVMKNHSHLRGLNAVLGQLRLAGVPVLVIDDEADQAGLNNLVNQQGQSTIYSLLLDLKRCIPHHTFLQYTATPQAPLLINIIDVLSPSFAEILTPGPDYVTGADYFAQPHLVREIPAGQVPTRTNRLVAPPESLVEAMQLFFVGVAAGLVENGGSTGNRSMLVHPSQQTARHADYFTWVRDIKAEWQRVLALPIQEPDRADLVDSFRTAHADLLATTPDLPTFDRVLQRLSHALGRCQEVLVNAARGPTPQINWNDTYPHILVGGTAMDRGFTVRGLTVTYMPRQVGVGNADTVQQRARFLGYNRQYLGLCRVYLESTALEAYRRYVRHEEDVRQQLQQITNRVHPLQEWKRQFFLTNRLKPCRNSVLDLPYMRFNFSGDWYEPLAPSVDTAAANNALVAELLAALTLSQDTGSPQRSAMQRHLVARGAPLADVLRFLAQFRTTQLEESARFTGALLHLQQYHEEFPNAVVTIYVMSRGQDDSLERERSIKDSGEFSAKLFQGADPPAGRRVPEGSVYPGDRNLPFDDDVQVQIHFLRVLRETVVIANNVPVVAVRLRRRLPDDAVIQPGNRRRR